MTDLSHYLQDKRGAISALANHVGISPSQMSRVASGKARPSPELAQRIELATSGKVRATRLLGLEEAAVTFDRQVPPRPLGDGRWGAMVGPDGSLVLSPDAVKALGFVPGESLVVKPDCDHVRLSSSDRALRELQRELKALNSGGPSLVDELIAERRAEAARE